IHGGAWRSGSAAEHAFIAETFINAGAHIVLPDFNTVIEAGGRLLTMADQVHGALVWVYRNAESFGGDPGRIHLIGHSSGAHLSSVLLTTDWQKHGLPADTIKTGFCASGMYDLYPVSLSARSNYVKFDDETIANLSAIRHIDRLRAPLVVAYAEFDTPEFQRQARDFAAAVQKAGKPVTLLRGEGYNHFEVRETFGNPYGFLGRAVIEQMKLAG